MKESSSSIGLKKNYLYEVLATTFSMTNGNLVPNTSCMGMRLLDDSKIKISPYPETTTYKNLIANEYVIISFIDNIYFYALASLKLRNSTPNFSGIPAPYYGYMEQNLTNKFNDTFSTTEKGIPYLKDAWAFMICKSIEKKTNINENSLGEIKLTQFTLNIIEIKKMRESYKIFNRAENLTLEIIILATRVKIAKDQDKYDILNQTITKIDDFIEQVNRFGNNLNALEAIKYTKKYLESFGIIL